MRSTSVRFLTTAALLLGAAVVPLAGQASPAPSRMGQLPTLHPEAAALLQRVDREEMDLLAELAGGEDALPRRALLVLRDGQLFRHEVLGILADPTLPDPSAALAEAVERYRALPSALATRPKSMDVLYDHDDALAFRTAHPDDKGRLWSAHWYRLALTEPLADLPEGDARAAGVDTVVARYGAKLARGEPPHTYPSELPLAPAIAPGLILASPEAAMVWDNLALLTEVLADILSAPARGDVSAAIEAAVQHFQAPGVAVTGQVMWETMALRHGIFFQGGYPLAVMTESERNAEGHAMHMRSGRGAVIPGMMRR